MRNFIGFLSACLVLALVVPPTAARAQHWAPDFGSNFNTVRSILATPEPLMDLAHIKLAIDQMIDPSTDPTVTLKLIEDMVAEVKASVPDNASNLAKFKALRDYLYRPQPLGGKKPFMYDLHDDRNPKAQLLSVYLATRKGNCISMPALFIILGQRLDIPVALTTAPNHFYVKFRGDNGLWYGVETTDGGGWADDQWQLKQFPTITPTAIANGIYLQPLTMRETAAAIAGTLLGSYESLGTVASDLARVQLAEFLLKHYPKDISAMAHAYFGYLGLKRQLFVERYQRPSDIPANLEPLFEDLENGWLYWGNQATVNGSIPPQA